MDRERVVDAILRLLDNDQNGIKYALAQIKKNNAEFIAPKFQEQVRNKFTKSYEAIRTNIESIKTHRQTMEDNLVIERGVFKWNLAGKKTPPTSDYPEQYEAYTEAKEKLSRAESNLRTQISNLAYNKTHHLRFSSLSEEDRKAVMQKIEQAESNTFYLDSKGAIELYYHDQYISQEEIDWLIEKDKQFFEEIDLAEINPDLVELADAERTRISSQELSLDSDSSEINRYSILKALDHREDVNITSHSLQALYRAERQTDPYEAQMSYLKTLVTNHATHKLSDEDLKGIYDELLSDLESIETANYRFGEHWGQGALTTLDWADGEHQAKNHKFAIGLRDTFQSHVMSTQIKSALENSGAEILPGDIEYKDNKYRVPLIVFKQKPEEGTLTTAANAFIEEVRFTDVFQNRLDIAKELAFEVIEGENPSDEVSVQITFNKFGIKQAVPVVLLNAIKEAYPDEPEELVNEL